MFVYTALTCRAVSGVVDSGAISSFCSLLISFRAVTGLAAMAVLADSALSAKRIGIMPRKYSSSNRSASKGRVWSGTVGILSLKQEYRLG